MRILILTHARSGGKSFMNYISNELGYKKYHEPFINNGYGLSDEDINTKLLVDDNIVVKDFPFLITERGYDLNYVITKFDKVIIHQRGDHKDVAISLTYLQENGGIKIHTPYKITDEWIKDNEDKINQNLPIIFYTEEMSNITQNTSYDNCLMTTYDGIYNDKSDIPRLLKYLNIYNPIYLDILDNRHRLRNGEIGMDNFKIRPKLI
jgi:hypothetical protein